jgi:putative membrane protein
VAADVLSLLAQAGTPLQPDEVWTAWSFEPAVLGGLALAAWWYGQGARGVVSAGRRRAAAAAAVVLLVALVSPIDRLGGVLLSAHMVQHVLLVLVAAPLLAYAAPGDALLRGAPPGFVRTVARVRRRLGLAPRSVARARRATVAGLLYVGVLWGWHAQALYDLAVRNELVHVLEHGTFLAAGWFLWSVVLAPRVRDGDGYGASLLLLFVTALHSTFLAALMTFATSPWYPVYELAAVRFGRDPLADQQLAGALMWFPGTAVFATAGIVSLLRMLASDGTNEPEPSRPGPATVVRR